MSIRTSAFSVANSRSESALTSSVLPTPVGPEEQERAQRLVAVGQADAGAPHGVGDQLDGLLLPDDPRVQVGLQVLQPLELAGHQLAHRDAGARGHDGGDVGLADDHGRLGALAALGQPLLDPLDVVLDLGRVLVGLGVDRGLLLGEQPVALGLQPLHIVAAAGAQAHLRRGLVDEVDGLVGQAVLADVAVAQAGGGEQRVVADLAAVVTLVGLAQAAQDLDGLLDARLLDRDGREAARQGAVALDLAVLGERGGADHAQLAACEQRLEHVGGVHRALRVARAEDRVQLVDEEDHAALGLDDLGEDLLQAILELAAELRAGDHAGEVERDEPRAEQRVGHVALGDAERQALDDRGLADAGLADEHGVVLAPAGEDLDGLLDLVRAPDHGIDPACRRLGGQVAAELVERRGLGLGLLRSGALGAEARGHAALGRHQAGRAGFADHGRATLYAVGGHDPHRPGPLAADGARAAGDGSGGIGVGVQERWLL